MKVMSSIPSPTRNTASVFCTIKSNSLTAQPWLEAPKSVDLLWKNMMPVCVFGPLVLQSSAVHEAAPLSWYQQWGNMLSAWPPDGLLPLSHLVGNLSSHTWPRLPRSTWRAQLQLSHLKPSPGGSLWESELTVNICVTLWAWTSFILNMVVSSFSSSKM